MFDLESLKAWSRDNESLARTVCLAKAFAEMERERVDGYIRPVFDRFSFTADIDNGEPITKPIELYLSEDEKQTADYYAACDVAHRENGFTGPDGHCPALVAEALLMDAENTLLASLEGLLGIEGRRIPYSMREQALELALSAAINTPGEAS